MVIMPNGRRLPPQSSSSFHRSFRTFTVGFFAGLVCFAVMIFYISDMSIQHTIISHSSSSSSSNNHNFYDAMSKSAPQQWQPLKTASDSDLNDSVLAGLSCDEYGGPSNDLAQEMVYWQDIPSDRYGTILKYHLDTPKFLN